jgi:hypothetical protein
VKCEGVEPQAGLESRIDLARRRLEHPPGEDSAPGRFARAIARVLGLGFNVHLDLDMKISTRRRQVKSNGLPPRRAVSAIEASRSGTPGK